jgi:CHAT domain-containing protein
MTGVPDRVVDLVVLAACSTGLAAGAYDEAYSLGTAFLAAGVCSVLSTLWTIPDAGTSLLMFMFHHYRVTDRRPVWDALHRAQLWMIDPDRVVPGTMPDSLSRQIRHTDPADITAWAGFLHGGR